MTRTVVLASTFRHHHDHLGELISDIVYCFLISRRPVCRCCFSNPTPSVCVCHLHSFTHSNMDRAVAPYVSNCMSRTLLSTVSLPATQAAEDLYLVEFFGSLYLVVGVASTIYIFNDFISSCSCMKMKMLFGHSLSATATAMGKRINMIFRSTTQAAESGA